MKVFVKEFKNVYSIVYLLKPKDDAVHVKLIWLPEHLRVPEKTVCHFEISFRPSRESDTCRAFWLNGIVETLIELNAYKGPMNVIYVEPESDWERRMLIDALKMLSSDERAMNFDFEGRLCDMNTDKVVMNAVFGEYIVNAASREA